MKRLVVVVLAGLFMLSGLAYSADYKFGYADFEKVFNEYKKTKTEDAKLKAELDKKKAELDAKREEINKLRDSAELLGEEAKKAKQKEMGDKIKELREIQKQAEEGLIEARNKKWLEIFNEIKDVAGKYGKEKGYTFIFDDKALVYKADGFDLTDEIIKILNKEK